MKKVLVMFSKFILSRQSAAKDLEPATAISSISPTPLSLPRDPSAPTRVVSSSVQIAPRSFYRDSSDHFPRSTPAPGDRAPDRDGLLSSAPHRRASVQR